MVLIEITNPDAGASDLREWSVVELQGNLEKVAGAEALSFDGLDVGKLRFQKVGGPLPRRAGIAVEGFAGHHHRHHHHH